MTTHLRPKPDGTDSEPKRFHVKTFGCQMNVYDSERMSEALERDGYTQTADVADASVIVVNTCHIREKAAEKVYSDLGRLRQVKEARALDGLSTVIAVAGCVAQAEGREIARRQSAVDVVVGPQSYHRLPEFLARIRRDGGHVIETEFTGQDKFAELPSRRPVASASAFLTIQEGCDKFCTFCVVPYTRGLEYSRPVAQVIDEAQKLVANGTVEITLLGQNVNAYHGADANGAAISLSELIRRLAALPGLKRLRYMTSHPHDMTDALIDAHGNGGTDALMPFLHLPVQSGSDRVLMAMNRKHTAAHYQAIIQRLRRARPDIALSTDIIVGFPGETDADFQATLDLVREVTFAQTFSFKYSVRSGTPAGDLGDQVPETVKSDRLERLQRLLISQQVAFNQGHVGKVLPILFERRGKRAGQLTGRSPYLQLVHADGAADLIGRVVPVEIIAAGQTSLSGVIRQA